MDKFEVEAVFQLISKVKAANPHTHTHAEYQRQQNQYTHKPLIVEVLPFLSLPLFWSPPPTHKHTHTQIAPFGHLTDSKDSQRDKKKQENHLLGKRMQKQKDRPKK